MKSWYATEDGLAVWLGLIVVALALPAAAGVDLLGWLAATHVWLEPGKAVHPVAKAYANVPGLLSLFATFAFVLVLVSLGAFWLGLVLKKVCAGVHRHLLDQHSLLDHWSLRVYRPDA